MIEPGPFTELELKLTELLAGCRFLPGCWQKRFAKNMHGYTGNVTAKQRWYLYYLVYRYRKQIGPKAIIPAAEFLKRYPHCPITKFEVKQESIKHVTIPEKPDPDNSQLKLF